MRVLIPFLLLISQTVSAAPACESLLGSRSSVDVVVVFGYKDARPARFVGDRHERIAFVERLMEPCRQGSQSCGFRRSATDADVFTKLSPRGQRIQVTVTNSSVGSDDVENRADPFQVWKSEHAQKTFADGIKNADVVFYNGHSRFGGGPDFTPPLLAKDGTVNTVAYERRHTGLTSLLQSLARSTRLKVLALFSCTSSEHFNKQIRQVSQAGLISSHRLMYYSDAMDESLVALSDIIARKCPKGLSIDTRVATK